MLPDYRSDLFTHTIGGSLMLEYVAGVVMGINICTASVVLWGHFSQPWAPFSLIPCIMSLVLLWTVAD